MGRKRKHARETTALGVIPLYYTKKHFEERKKTVIDFTQAIRSRNRDTNQRELTKDEVAEQFALVVSQKYAATEPRYSELLGQLESPVCNNYWAKIACNEPMSEPNSEPQAEGPCFWITKRKLRPALIRQYPDCVTLETWDLDLVIVPGISLRCLSQLYFKETIESILKANNEMDSLYLYIRQLWTAIIRVVYHFESTAHQDSKLKEMDTPNVEVDNLLKGYRLAHLNLPSYSVRDLSSDHRHQVGNKSKAITGMVNTENREKGDLEEASVPGQVEKGMGDTKDGEDGKDEVDDDEEDLSRKRQKRTDVQRGKCKDFETELNSAGAAMPDFPIALEFADTTLSFRFKS